MTRKGKLNWFRHEEHKIAPVWAKHCTVIEVTEAKQMGYQGRQVGQCARKVLDLLKSM